MSRAHWINITETGASIRVYFKAPDPDTFGAMLDDFKRSVEVKHRRYDAADKSWRVHPAQRASLDNWSAAWAAKGAEVCRVRE